jgi:RHS repeat-associated protein
VLAVVTDNISLSQEASAAKVVTISDYYPFGSLMPGRSYNSKEYRYGYNGKEKDDEIKGEGNSLDYGARIYDPRIARWLSLDPLMSKYPGWSPYGYVRNSPISRIDPDGRTDFTATLISSKKVGNTVIKVIDVEVVYKVIDLSTAGVYNIQNLQSENFINSAFSGTYTEDNISVTINFKFKYEMASSLSEVKNNDNVLFIVDDVLPKSNDKHQDSDPVGRAFINGQVAASERDYAIRGGTITHEIGHNLGMHFKDNKEDPNHSTDLTHLMRPSVGGTNVYSEDLKNIFRRVTRISEEFKGEKIPYGNGNAKNSAKEFIKTGYKVNTQKKASAGL